MRELNKKFADKVKGLSQEERKAKMKDIQKERQAAVAEILNEEQQAKLKELMAKRRGAGKGKRSLNRPNSNRQIIQGGLYWPPFSISTCASRHSCAGFSPQTTH